MVAEHVDRSAGSSAALPHPELYPFKGRYFDAGSVRTHYLDEGTGPPVVMVHGNPTWSFYYRNLVLDLRDRHRCIVPDHVGCGLSDKPGDRQYPYTLERRVRDLESLLEHAGVRSDITLILHDWGGMIGMAYATRHAERIGRIVILNTAAFHMPAEKRLPWQLWACRNTLLGPMLVRGLNLFAGMAPIVCCRRKKLSREERSMYRAPYDSWRNRIAVLRFVQDIPLKPSDASYADVTSVEERLALLRDVPKLICWGMKDFVFDESFLRRWEQEFPDAAVHRFADCGHFVLEDAESEGIPLIRSFLEKGLSRHDSAAGTVP